MIKKTKLKAATVGSNAIPDANLVESIENQPTHYEEFFGNRPDYGDNSRYYHVVFSGVWPDGNIGFGSMSFYCNGMLNLPKSTATIADRFDYTEVVITGWKVLADREELNTLYAPNITDSPATSERYYYIHYAYVDAQGYQRFGGNAVRSNGMFNINQVKQQIGSAIGAQSLVILDWQVIDNEEDFIRLTA